MNKIETIITITLLILTFVFTSLPQNECKKIEKRAIEFLDEAVANGKQYYTYQDIEIIIFGEIQE